MKIAIIGGDIIQKKGGFETFTSELSKRINKESGISIVVYCENYGSDELIRDEYNGIKRVLVPRKGKWVWLILNRIISVNDAIRVEKVNVILLLGYVAAPFIKVSQLKKFNIKLIINPDGLEWKRSKYPLFLRAYLKLCELISVKKADVIVADSIKIGEYIKEKYKKICQYIPYGTNLIDLTKLGKENDFIRSLGLSPKEYYTVISRCVPENNLLMIIKGFKKCSTEKKLLIITNLDNSRYSKKVKKACINDKRIILYGPLYDEEKIIQVRSNAFGYIHGHSVGGTNPSLVEAMGCGNIIIAHNNVFNKEVISERLGYFFSNSDELEKIINLIDKERNLEAKTSLLIERAKNKYNWGDIVEKYILLFKSLEG